MPLDAKGRRSGCGSVGSDRPAGPSWAIVAGQSALTDRGRAVDSSGWRYTPGRGGPHTCKMNGALQRVDVLDFLALCFLFEHLRALSSPPSVVFCEHIATTFREGCRVDCKGLVINSGGGDWQGPPLGRARPSLPSCLSARPPVVDDGRGTT